MNHLLTLFLVALAVLVLNLPFGYWRVAVPKFSLRWFLAVHLPIPVVVAMRMLSGLGFKLYTFPVIIGAYFTGQYLGGALRRRNGRSTPPS